MPVTQLNALLNARAITVLALIRVESRKMREAVDAEISLANLRALGEHSHALRLGPTLMRQADELFVDVMTRHLAEPRDLVAPIVDQMRLMEACADIAEEAHRRSVGDKVVELQTTGTQLTQIVLADYVYDMAAGVYGFAAPTEVAEFFARAEHIINQAQIEELDTAMLDDDRRAGILRQLMDEEEWMMHTRSLQVHSLSATTMRRKINVHVFGGTIKEGELPEIMEQARESYFVPFSQQLAEVRNARGKAIFGA